MNVHSILRACGFAMAAGALCAVAAPGGIPVFGDDFNTAGLFIENWDASKGAMVEEGRAILPAGQSIRLRRVPEGDFAFAADLIFLPSEEAAPGHCGAILDGIHFMACPGAKATANTAYRLPGETRSRGTARPVDGFAYGRPYRLRVTRERVGDLFKYTYTLDGEAVDSFVAGLPAKGAISFYGYRTGLAVDNFQLFSLAGGDGSSNLAVNSAFDHLQEGMPLYMKPRLGGAFSFDGPFTNYLAYFALDDGTRAAGARSVRMTVGVAPDAPTANGVGTHNVNVVAGSPVTFSIFLKAAADAFPATLHIWELHHRNHAKKITVSREWQRYSFTLDKPERATVRASVAFDTPGTLWADALQVEVGAEPTPYKPSPLDRDKFAAGDAEAPAVPPDLALPRFDEAPIVDGALETCWFERAAKTDAFFLRGREPPANRTEAYLAYDAGALCLAVRAFVPDVTAVPAQARERDTLAIHSDECIEVFLDTTFGRERYFHLTMNAAGARTDMGPGRLIAWNGEWQGAAKLNAEASSVDYEFRLPFALFTDLNLSHRWGLNIGRNDRAAGNVVSLIRAREPNFHLPGLFPALLFAEGTLDAYRAGFRSLDLVESAAGGLAVTGMFENRSAKAVAAAVTVRQASGEQLGAATATLAPGETPVSVPVSQAGAAALDAVIEVAAEGRTLLTRAQRLARRQPLEIYTRLNYVMNEPTAALVGACRLPGAGTLKGRVAVAGQTFDAALDAAFVIEVPLAGIPDGKHPVTLTVGDGGAERARATAMLVKRPFRKGATQIDRQRRCLVVDGRPRLLIAPFFGVPRGVKPENREQVSGNLLRHHTEMGYRDLLIGAVDDPPVAELSQMVFDRCAAAGVKALYWPFQSWNRRNEVTPGARLQSVRSDGIVGWLVVDEPELYAKSEEVEPFMEAYRAASPYTPVFMNNTLIGIPGRFASLKTDILMLDDYLTNREGRKVIEMIRATEMMWEAGREERIPVFYFLAGENLHNHYREPTYAEQVAQTYGVILAGARGVSYFTSLTYSPEHYRALVDVNRELLALEETILSLEPVAPAAVANPAIRHLTRRTGDTLTVLALNAGNDHPVDAEIVLPAAFAGAAQAEVLFEGRRTAVRNGRIADTFAPLARHVYAVRQAP